MFIGQQLVLNLKLALHLIGKCSKLPVTAFILFGLYHMHYTGLGNIHWPLLLRLAKASRRFL